jgi:transcription elongation factor Elf1
MRGSVLLAQMPMLMRCIIASVISIFSVSALADIDIHNIRSCPRPDELIKVRAQRQEAFCPSLTIECQVAWEKHIRDVDKYNAFIDKCRRIGQGRTDRQLRTVPAQQQNQANPSLPSPSQPRLNESTAAAPATALNACIDACYARYPNDECLRIKILHKTKFGLLIDIARTGELTRQCSNRNASYAESCSRRCPNYFR